MIYEFDVSTITTPNQEVPVTSTITTGTTTTHSIINDNWYHYYPYYSNWTYSTTIYKYQLICPRCKTTNWGELDQIVDCSGKVGRKPCRATLKAIKHPVDFEVPVG
jgi:hypothetical protein